MSVTIKKFKIAFVQPNFSVGPESSNTFYLPVASGQIWSQIKASDLINRYELQEIIWRREPVSPLVKRLSTYDVVCFSTYVWNGNFNKTVAAELKKSNPNVLIMFGGPEISVDDADIFKNWPFIDVVCKQHL